MKKTMFKNDMYFNKFKNVNISIKLHSFVCYSPRDVHMIITHKRIQFNT